MKYCHNPKDVPQGDHFAIIEFSSIHIEGDERSRTAPGHGYPAHDEEVCQYIAFTDQAEWEAEIADRVKHENNGYGRRFVAIRARAANIDVRVVVDVGK